MAKVIGMAGMGANLQIDVSMSIHDAERIDRLVQQYGEDGDDWSFHITTDIAAALRNRDHSYDEVVLELPAGAFGHVVGLLLGRGEDNDADQLYHELVESALSKFLDRG